MDGLDVGGIRELLNPISAVLEADGYRLHVGEASATSVRVDVVARDEACAECLVQKPLLAAMIERALSDAGLPIVVVLGYPTENNSRGERR